MCRSKVWPFLTGADTSETHDWLTRRENTPQTLCRPCSAERDADTAHELVREEGRR